jgi:hypothetical protein
VDEPQPQSADALRKSISARFAVRLHCVLILCASFGVGVLVTWLLLVAGVHAMWMRYAFALLAAYLAFLFGVRIWLWYAGFERRMLPSRRSNLLDNLDVPDAVGSGGSRSSEVFRGAGGRFGGAGASFKFGDSAGSSGVDVGDDGWVLLLLLALLLALSGSVVWLIYAAPTILADAAFAALLSAGLVRSAKHIASGGWVASVVGHTWIAFAIVFVLALAFALVAQHRFPDAHTLAEVLHRL